MASDQSFVQFVVDQVSDVVTAEYRKMFGEYAIYVNGKVVALICDNQLFVKPTEGGKGYVGEMEMGAPYPGAKEYFVVGDEIEDGEWLGKLMKMTAEELPERKEKKKK